MARPRLGDVLLQQRLITQEQLDHALSIQRQTRQKLGQILVDEGILGEGKMLGALGQALAIPVVNLREIKPEREALRLLKASFCDTHNVFPFGFEVLSGRKRILVALNDPLNLTLLEQISFSSGHAVSPRLATRQAVHGAVRQYYFKETPSDLEQDDDEIINGEEFVVQHASAPAPGAKGAPSAAVPSGLRENIQALIGGRTEGDSVQELERKFWALMRILVKKGIVTREEFNQALTRGE